MKELKKQKAEQPIGAHKKVKPQPEEPRERKTEKSSNRELKQTKDTNSSDDVAKTIFAWIGIIVVVLVVGTTIISVLNEILPYNWWNKY